MTLSAGPPAVIVGFELNGLSVPDPVQCSTRCAEEIAALSGTSTST